MNFLLDTDTLIYFLKGNPAVVNRIARLADEHIHTSIINQAELLYGAFNSEHKKRNLDLVEKFLNKITILPFCEKSSYIFAEQKSKLKLNGKLLADMDLMIASISLANNITLVTNNEKHFKRLDSLKITNWIAA